MKPRISRRTMHRRNIMSFLRKARQCGRGNFDRMLRDVKYIKGYATPQTGRGIDVRGTLDTPAFRRFAVLNREKKARQTGRGFMGNMVGDYAWGQRMKYRIETIKENYDDRIFQKTQEEIHSPTRQGGSRRWATRCPRQRDSRQEIHWDFRPR